VLFIAVATPSLPDGGTDLRAVESVAREIGAR
jgi:UDP-glucose 6-dehydrogenase